MPVSEAHTRAIRRAVTSIPRGRVCAYGRVAEVAGLPGRARLVGRVLAELPGDDGLPWHRVIRASGELAFPCRSRNFARQAALLRNEGVVVTGGRVDLERFGWQLSLDEQLWGPA